MMDENAAGNGSVLVRGPGEGPGTWVLGSLFERLASGEETGGGFGLSLVTQPPGTATPVHIHTAEDEASSGKKRQAAAEEENDQGHNVNSLSFALAPATLDTGFAS